MRVVGIVVVDRRYSGMRRTAIADTVADEPVQPHN